uniref:Secreted protein n=1 Tax=Nelumbo nucifera TaxID=4432 RepID=A0A822ZSW5_NELNU|nr:TPA_asm: hypothetical protein HUJ06_017940 [Nelumbo nucifera]
MNNCTFVNFFIRMICTCCCARRQKYALETALATHQSIAKSPYWIKPHYPKSNGEQELCSLNVTIYLSGEQEGTE